MEAREIERATEKGGYVEIRYCLGRISTCAFFLFSPPLFRCLKNHSYRFVKSKCVFTPTIDCEGRTDLSVKETKKQSTFLFHSGFFFQRIVLMIFYAVLDVNKQKLIKLNDLDDNASFQVSDKTNVRSTHTHTKSDITIMLRTSSRIGDIYVSLIIWQTIL